MTLNSIEAGGAPEEVAQGVGKEGGRGDWGGDPLPRPGHEDQSGAEEEEAVQHLSREGPQCPGKAVSSPVHFHSEDQAKLQRIVASTRLWVSGYFVFLF